MGASPGCSAATTSVSGMFIRATAPKPTMATRHAMARAGRDCRSSPLALRNATTEPASPISQTTNPDASGIAIRWQGYVAREGLGITRIRNQASDASPAIGSSQNSQPLRSFSRRVSPGFDLWCGQ